MPKSGEGGQPPLQTDSLDCQKAKLLAVWQVLFPSGSQPLRPNLTVTGIGKLLQSLQPKTGETLVTEFPIAQLGWKVRLNFLIGLADWNRRRVSDSSSSWVRNGLSQPEFQFLPGKEA